MHCTCAQDACTPNLSMCTYPFHDLTRKRHIQVCGGTLLLILNFYRTALGAGSKLYEFQGELATVLMFSGTISEYTHINSL